MEEFFKTITSFVRHCLLFRGTFWPEAILGIFGWMALFTLAYSLYNIFTLEASA